MAAKIIPSLTGEYNKARRQLLLWSSILFAWELVGIDLSKVETSDNFGSIISAIKTPQAVPWVIVILVIYFVYRFVIEWLHCDESKRTQSVSKTDMGVSISIASLSILLFVYQLTTNSNVASEINLSDVLFMRLTNGILIFSIANMLSGKFLGLILLKIGIVKNYNTSINIHYIFLILIFILLTRLQLEKIPLGFTFIAIIGLLSFYVLKFIKKFLVLTK